MKITVTVREGTTPALYGALSEIEPRDRAERLRHLADIAALMESGRCPVPVHAGPSTDPIHAPGKRKVSADAVHAMGMDSWGEA